MAICFQGFLTSRADEKSTKEGQFSLDVKEEPLGSVCQEIARVTGYKIFVDPRWDGIPVSVSLKGVSLHEGLKRILSKYSTVINVDDAAKKCEVMIFERPGSIAGISHMGMVSAEKEKVRSPDEEVVPPTKDRGRGVTVRELEAIMARDHGGSSDKAEVIPPSVPGGKGLTRRELEAKIKVSRLSASPEQEVIPPDSSGKRGVTVRELEAMKSEGRGNRNMEQSMISSQVEIERGGRK